MDLATPLKSLRILFVDDEDSLRELMQMELPRLGHQVATCPDGRTALRVLDTETFDAAILDLRMPDMTGIQVLEHLKKVAPDTEAVMMTGYASTETAVEAMRLGAFDYITKPCRMTEIEAILLRIIDKKKIKQKNVALQTRVQAAEGPTLLIGDSAAMQAVHKLIDTVAPTDSQVLILGETGTGKELVARTIFEKSRRHDMPFVPVNCGALAPNLVEGELFGFRKGMFTGADRDHKGLFEVADTGTLFLDELGELDKNIQVKLLRFLESGELRKMGDHSPIRCDVRMIAATNRDLSKMVAAETFREDLVYRLNTFEIRLPSLRERLSDLPQLALHLLARAARRPMDQVRDLLQPEAIQAMYEYDWPGNIREMKNAMDYAFIISGGQPITAAHLPMNVRLRKPRLVSGSSNTAFSSGPTSAAASGPPATLQLYNESPGEAPKKLEDIEMEHILRVLQKHNGKKQTAATELGISLKTLYNKLNRWEELRGRVA